jgi:hypothetical protein
MKQNDDEGLRNRFETKTPVVAVASPEPTKLPVSRSGTARWWWASASCTLVAMTAMMSYYTWDEFPLGFHDMAARNASARRVFAIGMAAAGMQLIAVHTEVEEDVVATCGALAMTFVGCATDGGPPNAWFVLTRVMGFCYTYVFVRRGVPWTLLLSVPHVLAIGLVVVPLYGVVTGAVGWHELFRLKAWVYPIVMAWFVWVGHLADDAYHKRHAWRTSKVLQPSTLIAFVVISVVACVAILDVTERLWFHTHVLETTTFLPVWVRQIKAVLDNHLFVVAFFAASAWIVSRS